MTESISSTAPPQVAGDVWLDSLDSALRVLAAAEEPVHRMGEDRPKLHDLAVAKQTVADARGAIDAILFPNGHGEIPNRGGIDKARTDAMDALAAAERSRAGFIEAGAGDAEIDAAELKVRHAARAVDHAIAACDSLDAKEIAARRAALNALWDGFWPIYIRFQNEVVVDLRRLLENFEKIRRLNSHMQSIGACPAHETMPWPSVDFLLLLPGADDYIQGVAKAPAWNELVRAERRSAA